MDSVGQSSYSSGDWNDGASPSPLSGDVSSRSTAHARSQGGLSFWVAEGWRHLRPFLPFVLISCLVVVLIFLLQNIVYGGPFVDPLFFSKFDQRWPRPDLQHSTNQLEEQAPLATPTGQRHEEELAAGLI